MKHLIAVLALTASLFSTKAQCWSDPTPENRLSVGMGAGYGSIAGNAIANLQVEYNISRFRATYAQTMFFASSAPAFFEVRAGYQAGSTVSITPHAGTAYVLYNVDRGEHDIHLTAGAEFDMELSRTNTANPKLYIDYNRCGTYNLFILGFKASF